MTSETSHDPFEAAIDDILAEAKDVLIRKHHDYGPHNIGRAPGGPLNGLLVRMHDKMARLVNLVYERGGTTAVDEAIEDTLLDLQNYCVIARMVRDGEWPSE